MTLATTQQLTPERHAIWEDRYALRDEEGNRVEEHPEQTFRRTAKAIANNDQEEERFYDALSSFRLVPGGRILASAGAGNETMAYNCFVIPVSAKDPSNGRDSREAIFDTISTMVSIMSRGGGVGINWSTLRPRGSHLSRVNGTSSGAIGWMDVASAAVGEVEQGGSRRGAAMFMLHDWHPDVQEFTSIKRDPTKITNANISVAVSDDFMAAVANGDNWTLRFPDTQHPNYNSDWNGDLGDWMDRGFPVVDYATIPAQQLWRQICEGAWDNGEPGVVFLDRYNKMSTAAGVEKIICVNPCGEQGLGEYSVCNLASINLAQYVEADGQFDYVQFKKDVRTGIRFLDNVIDKSYYMEDFPMREKQMLLRRTGLGVMGLADALAAMKIRYGSDESVRFVEKYTRFMKEAALWESTTLAKEKGPAGGWKREMVNRPYLMDVDDGLRYHIEQHGLRNLFLLTQAPTGTTSLFAGVNSGIEPFFALEYERNDRIGKRIIRPKPYQDWLEENSSTQELMGGEKIQLLESELPDYFVTADQLSVEEHVAIQAAAQKYIDSSISKTVNAPNSHTVGDVDKLYRLVYDSNLKGISYFREGCNRAVVLSRKPQEEKIVEQPDIRTASPYMRPESVFGVTKRVRTKHGNAFVTVNFAEDNGPIEAFVHIGRASSDVSEWAEGLGRLISLLLKNGVAREAIVEQLTGVGGYSKMQPSLSTAVATALKDANMGVIPEELAPTEAVTTTHASLGEVCTNCGSAAYVHMEGCMTCQVCGMSKC